MNDWTLGLPLNKISCLIQLAKIRHDVVGLNSIIGLSEIELNSNSQALNYKL